MKNLLHLDFQSGFSLIELSISLLLLSFSSALLLRSQIGNQQLMTRLAYRQNAILYSASIFETMQQNKNQIAINSYRYNSRDEKPEVDCSQSDKPQGSAVDCNVSYWRCLLKSTLEDCLSNHTSDPSTVKTAIAYLPNAELEITYTADDGTNMTQLDLHWFGNGSQQQQLKLVRQW